MTKVRVGLVGTGVIAQVMHLHYLAELADRFEVAAVCDLDGESARACAERYGIPAAFTDWRELVAHPLDAVMVLTSGSHAPIAEAAARAGRHVFVEKPMCYSAAEGQAMVAAAEAAGVILMVGYPKRYDPAFARMREETAELDGARLLRVTTFESPLRPYIGHYPLLPRVPLPAEVADGLRADSDERIMAAIGTATELERQVYEMVLLDTLVHELNTVRGLLGEPTRLDYASLALDHVTVMLRFGDLPAAIHWIDLPGIARYEMEFALYAPDRRLRLTFPSPFLRNEPAMLEIEGGTGEHGPLLADRGGHRVRERVQERAGGVPRQHRHRPPAAHLGPGRPARRDPVPGHHRQSPPVGTGRPSNRGRGGSGRRRGQGGRDSYRSGRDNRMSADIAVANAPVSYGAFELTVGHDPDVPDGITVLDQVAAAGYAGIDLGPVGYLGSGERLGELLAERGLGLAGAYVELPYADHDALERTLPELDAILDVFDAVRSYLPGPPPRPTLAEAGSQARRNRPGRSVRDPSLGFDADAWRRFAAGLARVIDRCRDRGYEPTFHPETGTHVEAPWEIERVLEVSDVGLCLETGHMLLGGGDPVAMLRDLGDRVNHVHLKDARLPVMAEIIADEAPVTEIWTREAFCALGGGDLDADAVLDGLRRISFGGWLVVEQDILPRSAERFARAAAEQRHNREFLAARGL